MSEQIQAVALDKDGVIFDSERVYDQALMVALEQTGISLDKSLTDRFQGLGEESVIALLEEALPESMTVESFIYDYWYPERDRIMEEEGLPFVPGVESLIETLYEQGYPLALVTNDNTDNLLADFNRNRPELLKYFSVVITIDDVANGKPDPEPYQRAAALLGVASERLLVIEDSDPGALAAITSGANVLLLNPGAREVDSQVQAGMVKTIAHHREALEYLQ